MENKEYPGSTKQDCPDEIPSLFRNMASNTVAGFDNVDYSVRGQAMTTPRSAPFPDVTSSKAGTEPDVIQRYSDGSTVSLPVPSLKAMDAQRTHSISISMPTSPAGLQIGEIKRVLFSDNNAGSLNNGTAHQPANSTVTPEWKLKQAKFHSEPGAAGNAYSGEGKYPDPVDGQGRNPRVSRLKDKRFDSFKTWSGKLERQLSQLRGKPVEPKPDDCDTRNPEIEALPVHRYFDALEGPELETLKASEELVLPEDKLWPFLLRFPVSSFGMCLGVSSQAILWKTLATSASTKFLHIPLSVNLVLWCFGIAVTIMVAVTYSLKLIFFFEAVRREYYHPIRVNFFFAPWIACLFLVQGVPSVITEKLPAFLWYMLMAPILCLELKIYGQWMSGGQRRLSKVANPSNHLSIVGNFVGALLGASMGLKEGPIFFFAVGLAHYMVLFVTLYQRLPTNATLPKELHPVFFLFVAAPSVASMAWAKLQGSFDHGSRIAYFIALFLYTSLAVRVNFFRGFKFSLAWWAYTFPMTGASIATIKYADEIKNPITQTMSVLLSVISTITVSALLISTIIHAFVLWDLFPNDIAIAITEKRPKGSKRRTHIRTASSDTRDIKATVEMCAKGF